MISKVQSTVTMIKRENYEFPFHVSYVMIKEIFFIKYKYICSSLSKYFRLQLKRFKRNLLRKTVIDFFSS